MNAKFSEYVIPIGDIRINPGRVLKHVSTSQRPILLTSRGVAVVQSITDYEKSEEERAFMRGVVEGLADPEEGREISFRKAKARLGLE